MTYYRVYDPAISRWWQVDPAADVLTSWTPYNYSFNNPIRYNDPLGDCPPGTDCSSYWLGFGAAFVDNALFGITNLRSKAAEYVDDAQSFNTGQDHGDITSATIGAGMIEGGTGAGAVGVVLAPETAGISLTISAAGAGVALEGAVLVGAGIGNLTSQKDRLNTEEAPKGSEANPHDTPRQARRDAMRQEGIPTSQQAESQSQNSSGRSQEYKVPKSGGGTEIKSVQQQTMDSSHPGNPHYEAGKVKTDPRTGQPRMNDYGRPKLQNGKSKSYYKAYYND